MALTIKIRGDATHFSKTIAGVKVEASGLGGVMAKLAGGIGTAGLAAALTAAASGAVALGAGLALIKDASGKAAGIESLTMQFETLLGSAEAARERMQEIKTFAASTPFEVANLSETSKLLQTLGGNILATGEGLRMVGDAASIAGRPIQEVGLHIGRLFNAITSGTSAGESVARLQELGLMTGTVKREFEDLAEAQKKGKKPALDQMQAMAMLKEVFQKTDGAMLRLSMTTEGKLSNMKDAVDNLKVSFGTGFNDGLKAALDATNNFLPQLEDQFAEVGAFVGTALRQAVNGDLSLFVETGILIGEAINRGMQDVLGNAIVDGLIRPVAEWLEGGNMGTPEAKAKAREAANQYLGPTRGIKDRAAEIMDALRPMIEDLQIKADEKRSELPPGFVNKYDDMEKEQTKYLKKIAEGMGRPLMFGF